MVGEEATVLWADNIQFLAKKKGLKLADISKELDIPTSFYSRARKGDTAANAYTLDKLAGFLGVTVDALLHYDFAGLTPNELLVVSFLQKVLRQTDEGEIVWKKEREADFKGKCVEGRYRNLSHPLFEKEGGLEAALAAMAMTSDAYYYVYRSGFHMAGSRIRIVGDCFNAVLDGKSMLYLMNVAVEGKDGRVSGPEYELYLVNDNGVVNPVCCTVTESESSINTDLEALRNAANESSKHLRLTKNVKSFLESYVGTTDEDKGKKNHTVVTN